MSCRCLTGRGDELGFFSCVRLYCELRHDGATGDQVGPFEIEHVDLDAIVHRFVFETGVLLGTTSQALPRSACGRRVRRHGASLAPA
jgi:hypothetical protein